MSLRIRYIHILIYINMYIYISGFITWTSHYTGSQTFLLPLLMHSCPSSFNRDRTKHPGVASRESTSTPSSPLALLSPVSRNAGMEKAAHRGAEEAHHDVPGLELGEGGCCWLLPHLRDLGMGRVTEPWWKAALGKGLESKDQAVGSSDGHCHGQNSCCGSGGGGNTCQGRNTLLCLRAKESLGALTVRRVLCRCGPATHFMQRPRRCLAATHACDGGYVQLGAALSQAEILA